MEYSIREVAKIIGSKSNLLREDTITMLLTDSRTVSFPEQSLFLPSGLKQTTGINTFLNYISCAYAILW